MADGGLCGENVKWLLSGSVLIIFGTGKMDNYHPKIQLPPWHNHYELNESIKTAVIKDGVTSIGSRAFSAHVNLTNIIMPDSVTKIGEFTFCGCRSLTEIKIPEGVIAIGRGAFLGCTSLTSVTIPNSVTDLGQFNAPAWAYTFSSCSRLQKIYYPAGRGFEKMLSQDNNAQLIPYTVAPPAQVKPNLPAVKAKPTREPPKPANERKFFPVVEPAPEKLRWKVEGKKLTVGGVREIPAYSYGKLPWVGSVNVIQHIVIEEGVEKISAKAFSKCTHLEILTIPASVKTIGDLAFRFCYCGNRDVNGGKNVIWSLDDGVLTFKKNPAARNVADCSIGVVSWRAVEKNISGVKLERDVIPDKKFFDWRKSLSRDVPVSM